MSVSNKIYFNFPITMLNGFIDNPCNILERIIKYALYDRFINMNGKSDNPMSSALNFYGVEYEITNQALEKECRLIYQKYHFTTKVIGSIERQLCLDFIHKEPTDKSEFDYITLLALIALRSIIGTGGFKRITNDFLLCRMGGVSKNDLTKVEDKTILKYNSHYYIRKVKMELKDRYNVKIYDKNTRGWYASFVLDDLALATKAEAAKKKNRIARDTLHRNDLQKKALEILIKNDR